MLTVKAIGRALWANIGPGRIDRQLWFAAVRRTLVSPPANDVPTYCRFDLAIT
jgi:hypothetical protein